MFNGELNEVNFQSVSIKEIHRVLISFAKDKSSCWDGWIVELFLHFFALLGMYLLNMVEESRSSGRVSGFISLTFIALIPKASDTSTFLDFWPISLCNITLEEF